MLCWMVVAAAVALVGQPAGPYLPPPPPAPAPYYASPYAMVGGGSIGGAALALIGQLVMDKSRAKREARQQAKAIKAEAVKQVQQATASADQWIRDNFQSLFAARLAERDMRIAQLEKDHADEAARCDAAMSALRTQVDTLENKLSESETERGNLRRKDADQQGEIDRLRAEVARLRKQVDDSGPPRGIM